MIHLETTREAFEISHRTACATYHPVEVHLEEHIFRIGVLEHVIVHNLVLHLLELVRMVVISELHSGFLAHLAHLIEVTAVCPEVLQSLGNFHPRAHYVLHSGSLMVGDTLAPPLQRA